MSNTNDASGFPLKKALRCGGWAAFLILPLFGCGPEAAEGTLGSSCSSEGDCNSGLCVDGVCCESECTDPCMACEPGTGTCSAFVPAGEQDPNADPPCEPPYGCDGMGNCVDDPPIHTCTEDEECDSGYCVDNTCCQNECRTQCMSCANSAGTCTSYVPAGQQDLNADPACQAPYACDGQGNCRLGGGSQCTVNSDCASGFCVDGVCCESECTDPCMACSADDGTCTAFVEAGQPDPNGDPPCIGDSVCDGAGGCLLDRGAPCGDAGECLSGFCVDGVCCESECSDQCMSCANTQGTCTTFIPDGDEDLNSTPTCEDPYKCDGAGNCVEKGLPAGAACTDPSECESGFCEDNTCCMTQCNVPCMSCANPQGTCTTFVPQWEEDPGTCEAPNVCDGLGTCCENASQEAQRMPVDIIFVIDNSGSMTQEIISVENNINNSFASIIAASGLDYRVIMLSEHGESSGPESICVRSPLSNTDCSPIPNQPANNPPIFYHYSYPVYSHDSFCKVLDRFDKADQYNLAPSGYSAWLRPDAFKIFVEITDDGIDCDWGGYSFDDNDNINDGNSTATQFDQALCNLSPTHFGTTTTRNYMWYSIVCMAANNPATDPWEPSDPMTTSECSSSNCPAPGTGYQALSITTGGLRFPLCEYSHFDVVFNHIADSVISSMACQFSVPANVNPQEVSLRFTPSSGPAQDWPNVADAGSCSGLQWYYNDNNNPTMIYLCPQACDLAKNDDGATVEVLACVYD